MKKEDKNELFFIFISIVLFFIGRLFINNEQIKLIFSIIVLLISGRVMILEALNSIKVLNFSNENVLMFISVLGAFFIKEYSEAIMITVITQISDFFENYAQEKTKKSITTLMNIKPEFATIYKNKIWKKIEPNEVKINNIILIKSGEKIPLDSIVVDGEATLDMSNITGESRPIIVKKGDKLISGSINTNGVLKAKIISEYKNSVVYKILDLIENIGHKKANIETFLSKFSLYYTPFIIILSLIIAFIPPLLLRNDFLPWFKKSIMILVMSCPCGILISIPLTLFGGIGVASRNGILIKNSKYLEAMYFLKYAVFDKTGTITKGNFSVRKIKSFDEKISNDELLKITAHLEYYSKHPIAESIKNEYNKKYILKNITNFKEFNGLGVSAKYKENIYYIGNLEFMKMNNISINNIINNHIGTLIYIAKKNSIIGYILVGDSLRKNILELIKFLHSSNIETIILSGDSQNAVINVAKTIKVSKYYSNLLPMDKVEKIEELEKKINNTKYKLLFVGDGLNDAPVISRADIGIAMGGIGSDSTIEASDIVLMNDNISDIYNIIMLSKKTMAIIRQNLVITLGSKILVLFITLFGRGSIFLSTILGEGISVLAILNALRIFNVKFKKNNL